MRSSIVIIVGLISAVYLMNPTAGVLELIPDTVPVIGNLDEAGAALLLVNCFDYFGINLTGLLKKKKQSTDE